jgi:hypothetical protein
LEVAIEKFKWHITPDKILAKLIREEKRYVLRATNLLILFGIRKNCIEHINEPLGSTKGGEFVDCRETIRF